MIYAAIHSSFIKYPKEDDPVSHEHGIGPEEGSDLTKVEITELEANGYQILKQGARTRAS